MIEIKRRIYCDGKRAICAHILLIAGFLIFSFAALASAQIGNLGWNTAHPDLPLRQSAPDYILKDKIDISVDPGSKEATLRFNTSVPTVIAAAYYGLAKAQRNATRPQYECSSEEKLDKESISHEIRLDLKELKEIQDNSGDFAGAGGIIDYRISLYSPAANAPVCYHGRFCLDKDCNLQPCIVEGPFIDLLKPYGATVSFETDRPTEAAVFIDGNPYSDGITADRHEIEIAGLEDDTYYDYYIILDGRRALGNYSFKTAPTLGSPSFEFAFMSGSQGGNESDKVRSAGGVNYDALAELMIDAYNRQADLIVFGGGLVNGYCTIEDDYRKQLEGWKDASEPVGSALPIYEAVGSHEALMDVYEDGSHNGIRLDRPDGPGRSAETVFADEFVNPQDSFPSPENDSAPSYRENAYYFDYANSRFIVINTNYWYSSNPTVYGGNLEGYVMDRQLNWVESLLTDAGENPFIKHIFLIGYEPAFRNDGKQDEPHLLQRKMALWRLLSQNSKVAAALFGREHNCNRMEVDRRTPTSSNNVVNPNFKYSLWQVTSGNVGSPSDRLGNAPWRSEVKAFYPDSHYCLISVKGDKVELQVIGETGEIVDSCTLCSGPKSPSKEENKTAIRKRLNVPVSLKRNERNLKNLRI